MAVIKRNIDPYWHESYLIILILNKGRLRKGELLQRIREEQKKRTPVVGGENITHSGSAYRYWLKQRKDQWVITKYGDTLELTPLGKWIANSQLGALLDRGLFVDNFKCPMCTKPADLALLKPLPNTADTNAKGRLFMDTECPRCDYSIKRMGISEVLAKNEFIKFYNKALIELRKIVKVVGQLLEDC